MTYAPPDTNPQLPHFLCIGAQKAGTSWLNSQLERHPNVWLPAVKELHFFDHLYRPENRSWTTKHIQRGATRMLQYHLRAQAKDGKDVDWGYLQYLARVCCDPMFTEGWYRACFKRARAAARLRGDITPEYSTIPPEGIAHVLRLLDKPKVIYIIRDPVSRALSQLRMNAERQGADPDLMQWKRMAKHPDIDTRGDYLNYIPRWKQALPADDLLLLPYGDIRTDPLGLLRRVEAFLGLPPGETYRPDEQVHVSRRYDIPQPLVDILRERYEPQYAFLQAEFGSEFLERTR